MENQETKKFDITLPEGTKELVIREVSTVNELPVKAPIVINLSGTIKTVSEFISKRRNDISQINDLKCHVLVNREKMNITLKTNEDDSYQSGTVVGSIQTHPKFIEFGINSGKAWEPNELGQFFKMNRFYFTNSAENMDLVSKLKGFVANVNSKIEKEKAENGSFADNYSGVVTSNLPNAFKLKIPVFKGGKSEDIEVEFYATVNGREVKLSLMSPASIQILEETRDEIINEELLLIKEMNPEIVIIEQ